MAGVALYCYYKYPFWTYVRTDNFEALTEYKGNHISGLRGRQILIHKEFAPYLQKIDAYAQFHDVELIINQAYRVDGREVSRAIVEPGKLSNHLAGFAIDFNIESNGTIYFAHHLKRKKLNNLPENVQNFINSIRNDKDLRWGGDFSKDDPIHIDHPINVDNRGKWESYKIQCARDYARRIPQWKIWK